MRKFLLLSLLATTMATPAFAQHDRREHRAEEADNSSQEPGSRRPERSQSRQSDHRTPESQAQSQRQSSPQPDDIRPEQRQRASDSGQQQSGNWGGRDRSIDDGSSAVQQGAGDTVRNWRGAGRSNDGAQTQTDNDTVRNWRGRSRRADSPSEIQDRNLGITPESAVDRRSIEERNQRRVGDGSFDRNVRTTPGFGGRVRRIGNNAPVEGTAPPPVSSDLARRGNDNHRRWSGDWRRDGRYDWRRYRDRNRSRFHFSFYFDPFGWSYRRYDIGYRLWPNYYAQDYWLNDPWQYRLPPAYGPYRWVRYYDDALLVNIYTGTVVDVIHNFFW